MAINHLPPHPAGEQENGHGIGRYLSEAGFHFTDIFETDQALSLIVEMPGVGVLGIDDHPETSARKGVGPKDGAPGFRLDRDCSIERHGCGYALISRRSNRI